MTGNMTEEQIAIMVVWLWLGSPIMFLLAYLTIERLMKLFIRGEA